VSAFTPELIRLPLPDRAFVLAARAHAGQRDKAGLDYFTAHVYDVAERVGGQPGYVEAVAYLHDVLEDTDVTEAELRALFPEHVVDAVVALTRAAGEGPDDYYRRVRGNAVALLVKMADIESNADPQRMALLAEPVRERLMAKYAHAREVLHL
jgi:(p)ppGpp synthase/HD superfamily hydrolase